MSYSKPLSTKSIEKLFASWNPHTVEVLHTYEEEQQEIYNRLDEHGFYRLPTQYEIRDYDIMEEFVDILSGNMQERLSNAICGHGAFRRFKDTVHQMGIAEKWYAFQDEAYKRKAIEWCEENDIQYVQE